MSLSLKHRFAALCVALFMAAAPAAAQSKQTKFPSADAAAAAFVDALARSDGDAVRAMLGADYRKVMPLDEMTPDDKLDFLSAWAQGHRVVPRATARPCSRSARRTGRCRSRWSSTPTAGSSIPVPAPTK